MFLAALSLWAAPAWAQTPDVTWATAQQETFPAWAARRLAADEKAAVRKDWFAGKVAFEVAFSHLDGAALNDPVVVRGRLSLLDQAAVDRAAERLDSVPEVGSAARGATWRENREAALLAEEAAEVFERRLLVESAALLIRNPGLAARAIDREKAPWRRQIARAGRLPADHPERDAADRLAAQADGEMRRLDALIPTIRETMLRPGVGPLDPAEELARLETDGLGPAVRLALMVPALDTPNRVAVDTALAAWWQAVAESVETAQPLDVGAGPAAMEARVAELKAVHVERLSVVSELAEATTPAEIARRAAMAAWAAAALQDFDNANQALIEARGAQSQSAESVRQEHEAAEDAAEEAAAAQASASDARERRRAEILSRRAEAQSRAAKLTEEVESLATESEQVREDVELGISAIEENIQAILSSKPGQSAPDADAQYRALRVFSEKYRTGEIARGTQLINAKERFDEVEALVEADRARLDEAKIFLQKAGGSSTLKSAMEDWEAGLAGELESVERLVDVATGDRDVVLKGLHQARQSRRRVFGNVSRTARSEGQEHLFVDAADELSLFGPSVVMQLRDRLHAFLDLPFRLLNFNVLTGILSGSFALFVGLGFWFWAHGRADDWALQAANRVRKARPELRPSDLKALRDPVARFLRNLVDLLLGGFLVGPLGNLVPELGFFLYAYLWIALYRVLLASFDLVVVPSDEVRPAVTVVKRDVWELARLTVRVLLAFFILRSFTHYLLWEIFRFDVIEAVIRFFFNLAGLGGVAWGLHVWQPFLHARVSRRDQSSRAIALLSRDDTPALFRFAHGFAILAAFGVIIAYDLISGVAQEGSYFSRIFNAASRYRLQREDEKQRRKLPSEAIAAIVDNRTPGNQILARDEVTPVVAGAVANWRSVGRGGLLALVGGRGSGKRTACDGVQVQLREAGLEVVSVHLKERLSTDEHMLAWLGEALGVGSFETPEELVEALEALEPRAIVLQGMHRAYCKRVGGFGAISTLFYISNATSQQHFWIISMHKPTWDFFASSGSVVDESVFKTVVALAPMDASQLRTLTTARTRRAGWEVDFSDLATTNPLGGDPVVELERGINLFYRLLIEASEGNPTVALHLWTRCLEPQEDGKSAKVYMSQALQVGILDNLVDNALFALVALHIQDELDESELVEVTNLSPNAIRTTTRDLVMRGLLRREGDRFRILHEYIPVIARTLRRRHILHLGVS